MKKHAHQTDPSPYESGVWGTDAQPCPSERTLAAHVDGQLEASRAEAVDAHLDRCSSCAGAARRTEGLSDLLRTWETGRRAEAPSRLRAAVMRTVAPEAAALRRETSRASARSLAFAAGVCLALGGGASFARLGTDAVSPPAMHAVAAATPEVGGSAARASLGSLAIPHPSSIAWGVDALPISMPARVATPDRGAPPEPAASPERGRGPATDARAGVEPAFADDVATQAFARFGAFLATQDRVGELVYVVDDRALPACAAAPYARVRRVEAWHRDRARTSAELVTLDPSAAGYAVLDVLPLPPASQMASFLAKLPTFVDPSSRRTGGLVIRPLPGRVVTPTDPVEPAGPDGAAADDVEDLAAAVAAGRVVLRPDVRTDRTSVTLDVAPTTMAILIPAGELLAGGAGDRVVVEGLWLPPYAADRTVVLACLPIAHDEGGGGAPTPTGLVAGPELRGLVAYRADRDAVFALVDGQVADAAVDRGVAGRTSLLALYDRASADVARALAADFASRFDEGTAGFVASDLNDRFQGLEHTAFRGAARRALLERLLVGYLIESHTRTSVDAPRSGAAVGVALARLVEGAARLAPSPSTILMRGGGPAVRVGPEGGAFAPGTPPLPAPAPPAPPRRLSGEEPRSGVRLEGVPGETPRPPLVSGLVPGIR